jgi:hypothetical protein
MARPVLTAHRMNRLAGLVPTASQLLRLGLIGGGVLALVASSQAGERHDGTCPAGESCSPDTPTGLLFEGAPLGVFPALTAHTIAAGGRQSYRILDAETREPFALPFDAKVTGDGRSVAAIGGSQVTVAAATANTGHLRIVDPGGLLYDRLAIDSAAIATMRAAPAYATAYPVFDPPRWAAFAGGEATVTIVLSNADGGTVVDEDLAMRTPLPSARTSWDSFTLTTAGAGIASLLIDAGDISGREVRVPVVDVFDEIAVSAPTETGVGGDLRVCFAAWLRGDAPDSRDDTLVVGVPRQYRVTGPATPAAVQEYPSCLQLRTTGPGTVRVDLTIDDQMWTATVAVRGSMARTAGDLGALFGGPVAGERAMSVPD